MIALVLLAILFIGVGFGLLYFIGEFPWPGIIAIVIGLVFSVLAAIAYAT